MIRISVRDKRYIYPFNDYARDLRLANKPLWLHHNDVFEPITDREREAETLDEIFDPRFMVFEENKECIVYRDNLFFDKFFIEAFLKEAKKRNKPCRVAFSPSDPAFKEHALPLSVSYTPAGGIYLADLWYFPDGPTIENVENVIIDMEAKEIGYFHVPSYMASQSGNLTFNVPLRAFIAIDSWVHIMIADIGKSVV